MTATSETQPIETTFFQFVDFLRTHLNDVVYAEGGGISPEFPDFDLRPQDYLDYANSALADPSDANRINCIAHLKRAVECEADTFFHILKLRRRMNFPQKLEAIERLDLMPARSIVQLNRVRNKVEHEYAVPEIDDLSVYFDLVAGFVAAIEGAIFMLAASGEMLWYPEEYSSHLQLSLGVKYSPDDTSVIAEMFNAGKCLNYIVTADNWDEFLDSLRLLFLLIRGAFIVSSENIISHLPSTDAT